MFILRSQVNDYGRWWTSTEYGDSKAYSRAFYYNGNVTENNLEKTEAISVRRLKRNP